MKSAVEAWRGSVNAQDFETLLQTVRRRALAKSAVEADVDAFLRRGSVNAQDFETLLQTVRRRALATATRVVEAAGAQRS